MNTYFSLLDQACLFYLLVRLHYEDLMNLCKARSYLWKIVCTPFFQESWKKYNIKTVETKTNNEVINTDMDRLGKKHSRRYIYDDNVKTEQSYLNGKLEWLQIIWPYPPFWHSLSVGRYRYHN